MNKIVFAHASGDTFKMEHSLARTGRNRFSNSRKPVAIVTEATRKHERAEIATMKAPKGFTPTWRLQVIHETRCGR